MSTGRKLKLTRELITEAEKLVKMGNYINTVCQYLGISHETWYRWMREGEQASSGLKYEFYDTIKKAEAHAEMRNVTIIQQAGSDTWQAAAWYLERKFPDRWGKKDRLQADIKSEQVGDKHNTVTHHIMMDDPVSLELLDKLYSRHSELQE